MRGIMSNRTKDPSNSTGKPGHSSRMPGRKHIRFHDLSDLINVKLSKFTKALKIKSKSKSNKLTEVTNEEEQDDRHEDVEVILRSSNKSQQLNPASSSPAPVFTLFSSLPTEIRLLIWEFALPSRRLVPLIQKPLKTSPFIHLGRVSSTWPTSSHLPPPGIEASPPLHISTLNPEDKAELDFSERMNLSNLAGFESPTPAPSILLVNHEAHEVVTKHFTPAFGAHCALPTTWFSYEHDTLVLQMTEVTEFFLYHELRNNFLEEMLSRIFSTERALVRNIAVDLSRCEDHDWVSYMWLGWVIVLFPNVRNFHFQLPTTRGALRDLEEGEEVSQVTRAIRQEAFEEAFHDYRLHGTVKYEVTGWKEYLKKEHGFKELVVKEVVLEDWKQSEGLN